MITSPCAYPCTSSAGDRLGLTTLIRVDDTGKITTPITDARTADLWVADHEGVLHAIPGGVAAIEGARVVENELTAPDDFMDAAWTQEKAGTASVIVVTNNYAAAPDGSITAGRLQYDLNGGTSGEDFAGFIQNTGNIGSPGCASVWLKSNDGNSHKFTLKGQGPNVGQRLITITTSWQRFTVSITATSNPGIRLYLTGSTALHDTADISIWHPQREDKAGSSQPTIPSEYTPDIAFYATENGNSVDANGVVTEAVGALITTPMRFVHAPAATNYADGNNDLTAGSETVTLSSTGNYTLSVYGTAAVTVAAGTAVGTGFGQATEGNPITFNLTASGTVTLTLDSGTLDTVGGAAAKQVEAGTQATPIIPTSGATASRDACQMRAPYAGNFKQSQGTVYVEYESSVTYGPSAPEALIVTLGDQRGFLYYNANSSRLLSYDGTNSAYLDASQSAWIRQHGCLTYNSTDMVLHSRQREVATWEHGPVVPYDGEFRMREPYIELGRYADHMLYFYNLEILSKDIGTAGIESRYSLAKVG